MTADGELWLVVVDGRQSFSDGATLEEFAAIMARLGCVDAMNLDGGGSSDLALTGYPVTRPSDGLERPVANGFLLIENPGATPEPKFSHKLAMRYPSGLEPKGRFNLSLVEGSERVPNSEIIWTASGDGWVDQGGTVHGFESGTVKITAYARGTRLQVSLPIGTGKSASPKKASRKSDPTPSVKN